VNFEKKKKGVGTPELKRALKPKRPWEQENQTQPTKKVEEKGRLRRTAQRNVGLMRLEKEVRQVKLRKKKKKSEKVQREKG